MKRLAIALLAATGLVGLSHIASAADLPVKASVYNAPVAVAPSWTGFYVGVNVGYGWDNNSVNYSPNDPVAALLFTGGPGNLEPLASSYGLKQNGAVGGFGAGYNWQAGPNWLWGLEADFSFTSMKGQASSTSFYQAPPATPTWLHSTNAQQNTDWYGTLRGRLGWLATPNILLFGTGGLAYGRVTGSATYTNTEQFSGQNFGGFSFNCLAAGAPCFTGSSSAIRVGWTAGGGAEFLLTRNWSAKAEYQLVDLGTETVRVTAVTPIGATAPSSFNAAFRNEFQVVRAGLNYHF